MTAAQHVMSSGIDKILAILGEPFASWSAFVASLKQIPFPIASLQSQTGWLYLLSSLVVSYVVYRYLKQHGEVPEHQSFTKTVFPKEVYLHRSARIDYRFVLFDKVARYFLYVPFFSAVTWIVYSRTIRVLGVGSLHVPDAGAVWILPTFAMVMSDLSMYCAHRLMHEVQFLWSFHEVHHSAEVLTPVTGYRVHPVEELITTSIQSLFIALSAVLVSSTTAVDVTRTSIFGIHAITFAFYLFAFQLRHSHIWLSYGAFWSRIFISPAQHQIHHSAERKHWNRNYGFVFAVWDQIFDSIYVPKEREHITFGSGNDHEYLTARQLYFKPFVYSAQELRRSLATLARRLRPRTAVSRGLDQQPSSVSQQPHATREQSTAQTTART